MTQSLSKPWTGVSHQSSSALGKIRTCNYPGKNRIRSHCVTKAYWCEHQKNRAAGAKRNRLPASVRRLEPNSFGSSLLTASVRGLEPLQTGLESVVLPLHYTLMVSQLRIERSSSRLQPDALTLCATETKCGGAIAPHRQSTIQLSNLLSVQRRVRVNQDGFHVRHRHGWEERIRTSMNRIRIGHLAFG